MMYIVMMLAAGAMIAMQSPINAALSRSVGVLESCLISFGVGTSFLIVTTLLWGRGQLSAVVQTPAWQWLGGIMGALMVLGTIVAVPRIGVLGTVLAMVVGNLAMAAVIDHYGWFGVAVRSFDWWRALGLLLVLAGMLLVLRR